MRESASWVEGGKVRESASWVEGGKVIDFRGC